MRLTTVDHDRGSAGMRYLYPVLSRRAGGLSIGVNLNPNSACNWRCIYCQVPDLTRGKAPPIDIDQLGEELRELMGQVLRGDALERWLPQGSRQLRDLAFSGNGEPTSSRQLDAIVERVGSVLDEFGLLRQLPVVLITNGTLIGRGWVDPALARLARMGGRVWFKLDSASSQGLERMASTPVDAGAHLGRLRRAGSLCPIWVQTCMVAIDGEPPAESELAAYTEAMAQAATEQGIEGVLLYGLARPSMQPEAHRLSALPREWLDVLARRLEERGVTVRVHA